jgi:hypothetical protein
MSGTVYAELLLPQLQLSYDMFSYTVYIDLQTAIVTIMNKIGTCFRSSCLLNRHTQ